MAIVLMFAPRPTPCLKMLDSQFSPARVTLEISPRARRRVRGDVGEGHHLGEPRDLMLGLVGSEASSILEAACHQTRASSMSASLSLSDRFSEASRSASCAYCRNSSAAIMRVPFAFGCCP